MNLIPVQLYYEEYGKGFPVVFLHGFPFDHTIWEPLVPLMTGKARLILPDLRGLGRSPAPDGIYSMRLLAEDVLTLMDTLKIECAILIGHSMGGYASLAFAQAYPHRLAGLGLVCTQAGADAPERRQARYQTAEEVGRKGVKVVAENMAPKLTKNPELVKPLQKLIMQNKPKGIIASLKGMAERPDALGWLSAISVPAVVLAGEADGLVSPERAQTMTQLLGKAWLVELPGVGHMPMMEAPQATADALNQLIQRVISG
jgi:pimeloyl-ACP methyl ester carboxylesterase